MSRAGFHGHESQSGPLLPRFTRHMSSLLARVADGVQNPLELPAKPQLESRMPARKGREEEALTWWPRKDKGPSALRGRPGMARGKRLSTALAARGGRVLFDSSNTSAETLCGSSGLEVVFGDTSAIARYVADELPPRSNDSEGTNISRSITAASENPRRANSPETRSESVSKRACMPEAFSDQVLMADHTRCEPARRFSNESGVPSSQEWSDSDHDDAIKARAVSASRGCLSAGRTCRKAEIPPISIHLIQRIPPIPMHLTQKDERAKQALLWESASATTAASKEELRLAGVLAPEQQFSPKSFSSEDEAQDPVFDGTRQHALCTVFQDAALNLADLAAEFSEDPMEMWGTQRQ